eukprot:768479-Hanusia_phi.AAC.6
MESTMYRSWLNVADACLGNGTTVSRRGGERRRAVEERSKDGTGQDRTRQYMRGFERRIARRRSGEDSIKAGEGQGFSLSDSTKQTIQAMKILLSQLGVNVHSTSTGRQRLKISE